MSIAKRSEIIFIYDISWANPNGDPLDSNKPRIDTETGINYVTDVRLKRTIRDELLSRGFDILIKDTYQIDGSLSDAKARAMDFMPEGAKRGTSKLTQEQVKELHTNVLNSCIDARLFGCTLPYEIKDSKGKRVDSGSVTYTGPVQFKVGYSMHPVKCELIKGTGAFASSDSKDQKTFRQEYVLPYSLILFYGIVNDRAAKDAKLSEDEIRLLLDAIWDGTKNLISRTKAGQTPRLLMRVKYSDDHYIGELDKFIKFAYEGEGESIRDISDGKLDFESLANILMTNKKHIDSIELRLNKRMNTDIELAKVIENLGIRLINL